MSLLIREKDGFKYVDEGEGQMLMLLHGLFGALSNWEGVVSHYSKHLRVIIPMLPIYEMPIKEAGLVGLREFTEKFVDAMGLDNMIIMGNSLGGHVGILYLLLTTQLSIRKLVLTGSSGLFENTMGGSYPRRGSYDYIRERVAYTFYDPNVASKELVDEVFETTKSIPKCMRIVAIAKSAQRNNLASGITEHKGSHIIDLGIKRYNNSTNGRA